VRGLRVRGVDVLTVDEAGLAGEPDEAQLAFASQEARVLYTFNAGDFCNLHAEFMTQGRDHAGIVVVVRQRYSVGEQIRRLARLSLSRSMEEMRNTLLFL
jgi:hypothetical protein